MGDPDFLCLILESNGALDLIVALDKIGKLRYIDKHERII